MLGLTNRGLELLEYARKIVNASFDLSLASSGQPQKIDGSAIIYAGELTVPLATQNNFKITTRKTRH